MASRAEGERSRESLSPPPPPPAPPSIPQPAPLLPLPSKRLSSNFSSYFNCPPNLRSRKEPGRGEGEKRSEREAPPESLRSRSPVCSLLPPPSFLSPSPVPPPHPGKLLGRGCTWTRAAQAETGRGSAHAHTGSIALITPPPTCCGARSAGQQLQSRCAVALRLAPILKASSLTGSGWARRRPRKRSRG